MSQTNSFDKLGGFSEEGVRIIFTRTTQDGQEIIEEHEITGWACNDEKGEVNNGN